MRAAVAAACWLSVATAALAQAAGRPYTLSFPQRAHRLMNVEVTFAEVPAGVLQLRMSRSSPGRYAIHEFAKNVFDVAITDGAGQRLSFTRPNPHQWDVQQPGGTVRVSYRVFGDRVDGTYLAIDSTHAHINMPAAMMWARGLAERPVQVRFEPPPGTSWRVATQLFPGADAVHLHRAEPAVPDGQPVGVRRLRPADLHRRPTARASRSFASPCTTRATAASSTASSRDVEKIVREARNVFGEFAPFDGNTYTFLADYLPWANGDGMEHRNSTVVTSTSSIRGNRADLLDTVAHEFFHSWNVERIRPASLEPFNLEDANISGELWFAEGFTSYYAPLITTRAGPDQRARVRAGDGAGGERRAEQPRAPGADRRADEPAGAVRRTRPRRSTAPTSTTPSSPTTPGARRSAWAWTCRFASGRTGGSRWTR